ncbi:ABC transporter substrate-binding protein [Paenibacillus sp. IB182496]|uniref:ABC transporter substrate-binding protein n=1 Tax=Paenibacillus sabuli TaxID=2772509 RepID=A0A927BRU7_9BACL|nr:ABC transporter substrate-binding protein [Paenibacillus sabuli]MBD2844384.1 ABC transporter substrate-binding protein [Paenibacillus sabuli]
MFRKMSIVLGVTLALLLVVAGCASNESVNEQTEAADNESKVPATTDEPQTRIVTDMFGEVEIPTNPERMIVTNTRYAEYMIELGIVPSGVLYVADVEPDYRLDYFANHGVELIEYPQYEQNYELLLTLNSDMIVAYGATVGDGIYEQLSKISPTVAVPGTIFMSDAMPALAAIFEREEQLESVTAAFTAKVEAAKAQLAPYAEGKTVLVLRVDPNQYRFLGSKSQGASELFYQQLGLQIPEVLKDGEAWFNPFSLEILPEINPDYIFIEKRVMEGGDSDQSWEDLMGNSLWKNLDAVKNNRVFPVGTKDLVQGEGPIGSAYLIDFIVESIISVK